MTDEPLIAGIELGGTKCIASLARGRTIVRQERWPTGTPDTLGLISAEVARWIEEEPIAAIGIASFGPLMLDPAHPRFGHMGRTPKPGWAGADIAGHFRERFDLPIAIDTDVNGAALAEGHWGAAQGCDAHIYATVGTGVGLGVVIDGRPLHGRMHPEAGHMRIRRQAGDDFPGCCPSHGDCIEGLVSGPGLMARAGRPLAEVEDDDLLWRRVAMDLGEWAAMLILALSPQRFVIGGGVPQLRPGLLPVIRHHAGTLLNDYLDDLDEAAMDRLIVAPGLGSDAGPLGAVMLGRAALGC
ncbi:MAG: ROK family protein [Pseudomonadota bacterium]|uniref:ROK family protein n=1 Tax=Rhizorhabdus phycosphaerae TaxID=2711156 RepID=UPI0013EA1B66|nr:ROK family protein [Rhizorhabdus phycosphaerae]